MFPRKWIKTRGALEHLQVAISSTWCDLVGNSFGSGLVELQAAFDNLTGGQWKSSKLGGWFHRQPSGSSWGLTGLW